MSELSSIDRGEYAKINEAYCHTEQTFREIVDQRATRLRALEWHRGVPDTGSIFRNLGRQILVKARIDSPVREAHAWKFEPLHDSGGVRVTHNAAQNTISLELAENIGMYGAPVPVLRANLRENGLEYFRPNPLRAEYSSFDGKKAGWGRMHIPVELLADEGAPLDEKLRTVSAIIDLSKEYGRVATYADCLSSWVMAANHPDFNRNVPYEDVYGQYLSRRAEILGQVGYGPEESGRFEG